MNYPAQGVIVIGQPSGEIVTETHSSNSACSPIELSSERVKDLNALKLN